MVAGDERVAGASTVLGPGDARGVARLELLVYVQLGAELVLGAEAPALRGALQHLDL